MNYLPTQAQLNAYGAQVLTLIDYQNIAYPYVALMAEVVELQTAIDTHYTLNTLDTLPAVISELGDVCWMVCAISYAHGPGIDVADLIPFVGKKRSWDDPTNYTRYDGLLINLAKAACLIDKPLRKGLANPYPPEFSAAILPAMGRVCYVCQHLNLSIADVFADNIVKLRARKLSH